MTRGSPIAASERNLVKTNLFTRAIATAGISLLALTACTSGNASDSAPAAAPAGGTKTVGLVQFSGDDVFSNGTLEGAAKYAESQGWKTITVDAKGSVDAANSAMTNLVTRGVSAIITTVFPSDAMGAGIAAAKDAGVTVATWGGGLADGVKFASETGLGDDLAARVVKDMGGKGDLLALTYPPGRICQHREESLDKAVASTPIKMNKQQITIPGAVNSALDATLAWAAAHPAGSAPLAIWSCYDDPATGVVAGLEQLGRSDIKSYGLNGTKEAIKLVKEGKLTATLWIDGAKQGEDLMKMIASDLANGGKDAPKEVGGDIVLVDSTTVEKFLVDHPNFKS